MIKKMKTSQKGIDLIKKYEGCKLTAYLCPAKIWTIGYGHTGTVANEKIRQGMKITSLMAETLLEIDLQKFEYAINSSVEVELNQHQFDSLVSFVFNIGIGAFQKSTMLKLLNNGDLNLASNQFDRWIYGGGKKLAGLIKRRADEKKLFLSRVM